MVRRHNRRRWTDHKKETIRPTYEKTKIEIFSFDHDLTQTFLPLSRNFDGVNLKKTDHKSLKCYESKDSVSSFTVEMDCKISEIGQYRIDILYENKNTYDYVGGYDFTLKSKAKKLYTNTNKINTYITQWKGTNSKIKAIKDAKKKATATQKNQKLQSKIATYRRTNASDLKFDGEKDFVKRNTVFLDLNETGTYHLTLEIPVNCYFIGAMLRKVITFVGDNDDSVGTNLEYKESDVTFSGMTSPSEASFIIGYDNSFECPKSPSSLYMAYMDEVNIYYKENAKFNNDEVIRRFGGYISTVKYNDDKTEITISCADRLVEGETKYLLNTLLILDGTQDPSEIEYYNPLTFKSYGEALKYICDVHETTLQNNIKKNFLVEGEKYTTGISIKFGSKKDVKKLTTKNATAQSSKNFITVRNNASGLQMQTIVLYDGKEHSKLPRLIRNPESKTPRDYSTFHMTYGLGDPAKSTESKSVSKSSTDYSATSGTQSFGKCGVSADGKYVMAIGTTSSAKDSGSYGTYYKGIFKNKCPHCGQAELRWDSCRSDTKCIYTGSWGGSKGSWGVAEIETEITCNNCDSDFSALGNEKDSPWAELTRVGEIQTSSKSEQDKLHNGQMMANPSTGTVGSTEDIFKVITKEAFKYDYVLGATGQTYSEMKQTGHGDCWGFSDLIFTMLKKYKVNCKIVEYGTEYSSAHRSVMYVNENNQWVDFPYREYGWGTKYNNMLNNTSSSSSGSVVKINTTGGNISNAKGVTSSSSETSTVTTITGYDKSKPYQAWIEITYSTKQSWTAKKKKVNLTFTQHAGTENDINGLSTVWINNALRQTSVSLKGWFDDNEPNQKIYLHMIRFVTPKIKANVEDGEKDATWYTFDKSTHDYASCKMDLYNIIFDDRMALNPTDLQACGKTVNAMLTELVDASGYLVNMTYKQHRKDDIINFRINNETKVKFTATEGDDNNILKWSNISYSPVSTLRNNSVCVFKNSKNKYEYVETRDVESMIEYGEKTTLITQSEETGAKEAYFLARNSKEYNPEHEYSYTIVVPYAPNLKIGDLVAIISDEKQLNDVKPVESIHISYNIKDMPRIQTEIGLGELEPFLRIKKEQENLRQLTKAKTTVFSTSATAITDAEIYVWDN